MKTSSGSGSSSDESDYKSTQTSSSISSNKQRGFRFLARGRRRQRQPRQRQRQHAEQRQDQEAAMTAARRTKTTMTTTTTPRDDITSKSNSRSTVSNTPAEQKETTTTERTTPSQTSLTSSSFLCRTRYFRNLCDWAFSVVDTDESGTVDEKELYSGLLLIHLKLGTYAGPAACRPLGRERCKALFHKMDTDQNGCLDKDEFEQVMILLFSNVLFRVLVQWSMTILIVPMVAKRILNAIYAFVAFVGHVIANLDEYSSIANAIELTIEAIVNWTLQHTPNFVFAMQKIVAKVPQSVWDSVPLTLLSTILGILVVPWLLFLIDDFFQYLADRKRHQKQENGIVVVDNGNVHQSKPKAS